MQRKTMLAASVAALSFGLAVTAPWNTGVSHAQTAAPAPPANQAVPLTGTWAIDPAHSNVNFAIRHMGVGTVRGRFDDFSGAIVADAANPEKSSVNVTIKSTSIDTDVAMRDNHLRSADFFDVEKYPTITFQSKRVERGRNGGFVAHGALTMHGVSKDVSLPFKVAGPIADQRAGGRIGVETQTRLNRQDYGIKYGNVLPNGALAVGNDVDVIISVEATSVKPDAS